MHSLVCKHFKLNIDLLNKIINKLTKYFCLFISAICRTGVKDIQIPYLRTCHRFDFLCLFLATWMDILAILSACGALARTLSTCLDAMTGGLARIYILGRNSPANEPWPDVLGVSIIFLVTGMFMLGLENTNIFTFLMIFGVMGITSILAVVTWLKGSTDYWTEENVFPTGILGLLTGAAISSFTFPSELPNGGNQKRRKGILFIIAVLLCNGLTAGCISTLSQYNATREFEAVPILTLLSLKDFIKVTPAIACLLVLACSGAILELFPEMYNIVVKLANSEWKILAKQISYENRDSGSPILAVFLGGSLCAMLAFACPLQTLTHILAGSHLFSGILRASYLLFSPFRPKFVSPQTNSSLSYSRLNSGNPAPTTSRIKRTFFFLNKGISQSTVSLPKSKSKLKVKKIDEELEREWLLLGEPPSPIAKNPPQDAESCIVSDEPQINSDVDCITKANSDSDDSSTDIDAIVDEYRQKVKVSTLGPMDTFRVPSTTTWRFALLGILIIILGLTSTVTGVVIHDKISFLTGISVVIVTSLLMLILPKYKNNIDAPSSVTCAVSLLFGCVLVSSVLPISWPAVLFWFIAG